MPKEESDASLVASAIAESQEVFTLHEVNALKARYLGKNGVLQKALRGISQLPQHERAAAGAKANAERSQIESLFANRRNEIETTIANNRVNNEKNDITLPGRITSVNGSIHPIHISIKRAVAILNRIGFNVVEGPEIENDYYNFSALNQPEDHPARSMHDTFYLNDLPFLLRTHTSPVQIRHMEKHQNNIPIRAISPGRVYRCDHDATHSPMFHQIEGLWVDKMVTFTDLKGILGSFFRAFFENDDIEIRFRPSFFPFTEPSAECDIRWSSKDKWLEVAGCGMIHPTVLKNTGIDPDEYQGFAFGTGVERLTMLYYAIDDIRLFFENDGRFLSQFGR